SNVLSQLRVNPGGAWFVLAKLCAMMKAEGEPLAEKDFAKPLHWSGKNVQIPLKALNAPLSWSGFGEAVESNLGLRRVHSRSSTAVKQDGWTGLVFLSAIAIFPANAEEKLWRWYGRAFHPSQGILKDWR